MKHKVFITVELKSLSNNRNPTPSTPSTYKTPNDRKVESVCCLLHLVPRSVPSPPKQNRTGDRSLKEYEVERFGVKGVDVFVPQHVPEILRKVKVSRRFVVSSLRDP